MTKEQLVFLIVATLRAFLDSSVDRGTQHGAVNLRPDLKRMGEQNCYDSAALLGPCPPGVVDRCGGRLSCMRAWPNPVPLRV